MSKAGRPHHLSDYRIKRAVGMLRRAEVTKARVRFASKLVQESDDEPRLADPRFTRKQHHLTFAHLGPRPAPKQQLAFLLPPDQGSQGPVMKRLEAAVDRTGPHDRPYA